MKARAPRQRLEKGATGAEPVRRRHCCVGGRGRDGGKQHRTSAIWGASSSSQVAKPRIRLVKKPSLSAVKFGLVVLPPK